jgi:integrase
MSAAYRRGRNFSIRLPLRAGGTKIVGTGTRDRATAKAMQRMGEDLKGRHDWTLLETVTLEPNRTRRHLALGRLFAAFRANTLEQLRATMTDIDLTQHIPAWQDTLRARLSAGSRMVDRYVAIVRTLMPDGAAFPRSALTSAAIAAWQASAPSVPGRAKSGQSMRIQRRLALSSFCRYLVDVDILTRNPVKDVRGAGKLEPKVVWLSLPDMMRLIDAHPEPYRTLSMLLHGTGLEIGAALALRKRDLIPEHRAIRAPGTKNFQRDRVARVRAFAWPAIEQHARGLLPAAKLFEGISYYMAREAHVAACTAAEIIAGYTLHSARHSFSVQLRQEGVPFELIASNLGHKDTSEVQKCYGRFTVDVDQWAVWEGRIERHAADEKSRTRGAK